MEYEFGCKASNAKSPITGSKLRKEGYGLIDEKNPTTGETYPIYKSEDGKYIYKTYLDIEDYDLEKTQNNNILSKLKKYDGNHIREYFTFYEEEKYGDLDPTNLKLGDKNIINEYLSFPAGKITLKYYGKIDVKHFKNLIIGLTILTINDIWLTDIKPHNILIFEKDEEIKMKFCDLSSHFIPDLIKNNNLLNKSMVTKAYFPKQGWKAGGAIDIVDWITQRIVVVSEDKPYNINLLLYYHLFALIVTIENSILSKGNENFLKDIRSIITRENLIRKYKLRRNKNATIFNLINAWNENFKNNKITKEDYLPQI